MQNIRNFSIIAHIDHGKSTLADRFLELTGTLQKREMKHGQMLDMMDLEQERGITIKLAPVRMDWIFENQKYILNLIDTPGHVDFTYEVSRSLACCEGAILLVDATQGIQAQTLAHAHTALEYGLTIIPVINKIDLAAADPERVKHELKASLGIEPHDVIEISAKQGTNVESVLKAVISHVPHPKSTDHSGETKALIFDSVYDSYKGVVTYVRIFSGKISKGDRIYFLSTKIPLEVLEVGYFRPRYAPGQHLQTGEIGYVVTGVKKVSEARVGDTLWEKNSAGKASDAEFLLKARPLPGYKKITPYVFASLFCVEGDDYPLLRDALEKLSLNDASLTYEPESSEALGHGFRCGFLGLLHMDIVQERLEREYNLKLIMTSPSVSYQIVMQGGELISLSNPAELPDPSRLMEIREPWMKVEIITPKDYIGAIMKLCQERRGISKDLRYLDEKRAEIVFEIPLASVIVNFYDQLKSISSGYASLNYAFSDYRAENLVKLDILVGGKKVDALSSIVHRSEAYHLGVQLTKKLKEVIPRQLFEIPIQAAIGAKVIARETLGAMRKNVTSHLYGGDRTRKDKLLKKQKEGKKRMKMFGNVEVPQEAFLALLKRE